MSEVPSHVRIYEVGPRDGLQAENELVPTEVKVEFCRRLQSSGVNTVEVSSFVSPNWIPQLADAEEVIALLNRDPNWSAMRSVALVPNARGLDRAVTSGIGEIAVFASATQTFAERNLNSDRETALRRASTVARSAAAAGLAVRGYVSMAFGDPWEGTVDPGQVADCVVTLLESGCDSVSIADTIGIGTPGNVDAVVGAVLDGGGRADRLAMHLHDTYGQGLANVHASLQAGIAEFDTSAGGIGRCPYARGATGNLATEDLVWMLNGMGIETGIDVDALAATSRWFCERTGIANASSVATALSAREHTS